MGWLRQEVVRSGSDGDERGVHIAFPLLFLRSVYGPMFSDLKIFPGRTKVYREICLLAFATEIQGRISHVH